jgi:hypothetical protein
MINTSEQLGVNDHSLHQKLAAQGIRATPGQSERCGISS